VACALYLYSSFSFSKPPKLGMWNLAWRRNSVYMYTDVQVFIGGQNLRCSVQPISERNGVDPQKQTMMMMMTNKSCNSER
jgi:hypothetical protein